MTTICTSQNVVLQPFNPWSIFVNIIVLKSARRYQSYRLIRCVGSGTNCMSKFENKRADESTLAKIIEQRRAIEAQALLEKKKQQILRLKCEEKEILQAIEEQKIIATTLKGALIKNKKSSLNSKDSLHTKSLPSSLPSLRAKPAPLLKISQPNTTISQDIIKYQTNQNFHQNYIESNPISKLLKEVEQCTDFEKFFTEFPISLMISTGLYDNNFPIEMLFNTIENWPTQKQLDFYTTFFKDIRKTSMFLDIVSSLINSKTFHDIFFNIEELFPHFYSANRVVFYQYDNDKLITEHNNKKQIFSIEQGIFQNSLKSETLLFINSEDSEVTEFDKTLFQENKNVLLIPILIEDITEGLIAIYDKTNEFKVIDYLTISLISQYTSQLIQNIKEKEKKVQRQNALQNAIDTYLTLCDSSDIVTNVKFYFSDCFRCETVRVFKVSYKNKIYQEITFNQNLKEYPITKGIIGYCITKGITMNIKNPHLSEYYYNEVDSYGSNILTRSLLIGIILDENKIVRWAVALYNKNNQNEFPKIDEETLKVICNYLFPLLNNAWHDEKLKKTIRKSKARINHAKALNSAIAAIKSPTDLTTLITKMEKFFRENTSFSTVTLYIINRLRGELIDVISPQCEIININNSNSLEAECVRKAKIIENQNENGGTNIICCPIFDSTGSLNGVLKFDGSTDEVQKIGSITEQHGLLNRFHTSLSCSSFFSSMNENDKNSPIPFSEMIMLWQKLTGGVLEACSKYRKYKKIKSLIDYINIALYENLFDSSFKVWQEIQILIESFEDFEETTTNIEIPNITDIVFANTSELSEKTVQLIRNLQLLHTDEKMVYDFRKNSIYKEQMEEKNSNTENSNTENETKHISDFISTLNVDLISMEETDIIRNLIDSFQDLGMLQFFHITIKEAFNFLLELRGIHLTKNFNSWKLSVDHFQFAAYLILNTSIGSMLNNIEIISVLLFLLGMYSKPILTLDDFTPEKATRYSLEVGGCLSIISSLFACCAWSPVHIFKNLHVEDITNIWNLIDDLEISLNDNTFYGAPPALLLCCMAQYSYMFRDGEVVKNWLDLRMKNEMPVEMSDNLDEIKEFQVEIEKNSIIMPLMDEAIRMEISLKFLKEKVLANYEKLKIKTKDV